ncbi:MAG TPA: type ISP restriction/modification enzyme [Sphingobacteriaceae bacterium]|nr:type ISP restriction/modification enzyme [Sphingobacteriaceae bacterium]
MTLQSYVDIINLRYKTGISREHTYRGDLQALLMNLLPDILVTNEPARVACGAPDYMLTRKDIPVGYIEAKDIGVDLHSKTLKEQFERYKSGLSNLIFTDYLDFHFYKDGVFTTSVSIAKIENGAIIPIPSNFDTFQGLIKNFALTISQTIKSPTKLAEMMAGKAKLMADIIEKSLNFDDDNDTQSSLKKQMLSFKQMLIHDIDNKAFSDIYAQTIAYGMFAARYHDPTLPTFSRQEAATLIPKSNPFLRKLFQDIAGYDLDDRLVWIVDELVNIFLASDVADIMRNFGKSTKQEDPVVHFYETFLAAYNPALRKARGVWYTPQPVVNFIVRAVDDILKTEFNLPQGLADTTKIKVKSKHHTKATTDQRSKMKEVELEHEVHKVQILDPATGTGTFLAEVVRHIYKNFEGQQGIWSNYVNQHLIPRLNGFELLMASYAMAHLKMDMLLTETGYKATTDQRLRIFLTNSLEEAHRDTGTLFSSWLSDEADQANAVKRDTPVMVVIGNPPYSVSSSNKSEWIEKLTADYKKDLKEKNIQPLSDDYIKFIRFGQHFIEKNGDGILAYISNNSFLDGLIHRQMRKHLLEGFDDIYILDLHGDAKKQEICLDGSPDQNVFDIMQGVSINIFVKTSRTKNLGKIYHSSLQGSRNYKYEFLNQNKLSTINWKDLDFNEPNFFFVEKNFSGKETYEIGFKLDELFTKYNNGIETGKDSFFYSLSKNEHIKLLKLAFSNKSEAIKDFQITNTESFKFLDKLSVSTFNENLLRPISYRPFDVISCYYDRDLQRRPAYSTMRNLFKPNLGLLVPRQVNDNFHHVFISSYPTDCNLTGTAKKFGSAPLFPLYVYPETSSQQTLSPNQRIANLSKDIINNIAKKLEISFTNEKVENNKTFAPIDILDYIYSVLHSPAYRDKYKEFLKIDFPRVPYPQDQNTFWKLVKLGGELRQIHLLESPEVNKYITQYPIDGDNIVTKIKFEENYEIIDGDTITNMDPVYPMGRVYINDTQFFQLVPEVAWKFYIGGYQPAQKWLKDRKGRELSFEDILHYQKVIVALKRTDELMKEIDLVTI